MKRYLLIAVSVMLLSIAASGVRAQGKQITLCWAAWDPANALRELSKDFTTKTGIRMRFEFVPWTSFADRFLNELNSHGKLCDVLIGDSQWIGGSATFGHYIELTDFFKKNGISMDDFLPATVYAYSTWPKGSKHYWALPAMGDALAWIYRKDWFARPELRKAFKAKYGHELGVPKNWNQIMEIGKFFQGRSIDGKKRYGLAIYTERGSEGITMGVDGIMFPWGAKFQDPDKPYHTNGFINGPKAVEALEYYKKLYKCCSPPGHADAYMVANLDAYKSGQVAMQMNWFAFMPGIAKDENVGGEHSGFFANPPQNIEASMIGGQGMSVVSYSDKKPLALQYIKWFAQPDVQKKWWSLGGYSCRKSVLLAPGFSKTAPYASEFLKAMRTVQDFWQDPSYAQLLQAMQKRVHDYVVADKGTAQQALDKLSKDWTAVFEEEGKL